MGPCKKYLTYTIRNFSPQTKVIHVKNMCDFRERTITQRQTQGNYIIIDTQIIILFHFIVDQAAQWLELPTAAQKVSV